MRHLEIADLQDHGDGLHDKNAAHDEEHKLLARNDRHRPQSAAQGERADVAHKDLRRVGVVPKKAQARPNQRGSDHHHFSGARNIREIQIRGIVNAPDDISKYAKRDTDERARQNR